MARIVLSAGHRNSNGGGHPCELGDCRTGMIVKHLAGYLRTAGHDVRVVQPQDGTGMFPGGLQAAARQAVVWHKAGWKPDLFLEVHFEGNGQGDVGRGCFVIYPDKAGELDTDARDKLAPLICQGITRATGIPQRGNGLMPESRTGVGSQGVNRLGVFAALSPIKRTLTRCLVEVAACTSPSDMAIISQPGFNERAAQGIADGICRFFAPVSVRTFEPEVEGIAVDQRILQAYERSGGVWQKDRFAPGLPLTLAFRHEDSNTYQVFERTAARITASGQVEWLLTSEVERLSAWYEEQAA